jgi:hypothetical protein
MNIKTPKLLSLLSFRKKTKIALALLFLTLVSSWFVYQKMSEGNKLNSRVWMEYAENVVREEKPTPPASARFYAYVASVYYDTLQKTHSEKQASLATAGIINFFYNNKTASSSELLSLLGFGGISLELETLEVLEKYKSRHYQDAKQMAYPVRLTGGEFWVGDNPLEPTAGSWQRWIVGTSTFTVQNPPKFKSAEYQKKFNRG